MYARKLRCSSLSNHMKLIVAQIGRQNCGLFPVPSPCTSSRWKPDRCKPQSVRLFSSKGDARSASEDNCVPPVKGVVDSKVGKESVRECSSSCSGSEHARLGELDQQEWLEGEKFFIESKRKESPFLTRRDRFKNEFLRRLIPWEKITLSLDKFPYYLHENTKRTLVECAATHLRHRSFASTYGSRLTSSGGKILLLSKAGTELYRERLVKALAHDLQVPLLVLDSSVLVPYDCDQDDLVTETEYEADSAEECSSESEADDENEEEWTSSAEAKTSESDDEEAARSSATNIRKFVPVNLEEFAKRVVGMSEDPSPSECSEAAESPEQEKRPLRKGDRVKYIGASKVANIENRIILGEIPTSDGSTNAYTFISGRPLANGQRGEVYEIDGDQVAVIFDNPVQDASNEEKNAIVKTQNLEPSIQWIDIQEIVHDFDSEAQDWHIAVEALEEILPSLQPAIVYFPDSSRWSSMIVHKSHRKKFLEKVEELFDQSKWPILLVCGQNVVEAAPKQKEKFTMVLPQLGPLTRLPFSLKQLTERFKTENSSKPRDLSKLFTNLLYIPFPNEEDQQRILNNQIEEDNKIIISRHNIIELHKVLEENGLSCLELLHLKTDGIILTRQKAEKVVGWARNHYLSSAVLPSVKSDRLIIPRESLDIAIDRLREQDTTAKRPSQNLKSMAKDEYESNFVSAVVPPGEIGVKFEDIGALEDVKRTLDELVTLPMRRPELFQHGNLLRPCKGILLFGPPGTGKTLLAKALATEAGAHFISITGSTLTSKWFGDAEKLTKALFSFASRLAPVIIFVDEVDSLLGARGGAFEHEATRRMRNEFMAAWDGLLSKETHRILILAATNRPFDLDDAVIRRLPRRIYVDLPDAENRAKILKILLAKENLEPGFKYEDLANSTEGYSGSDLKNLCIAAAYRPVQELLEGEKKAGVTSRKSPALRFLKLADFVESKSKVSPSVAYDATSMNELRKWNEQYGEGGSRKKSSFGFGN